METRQINNLGVSVYEPVEVEVERLRACKLELAFQFPFNVLDRRFENVEMTSWQEIRTIYILTGPARITQRSAAPLDILSLHKRYHDKLRNHVARPVDFATSFVKNSNCVDYFLVGINTVRQFKELLAIRFEAVWPKSFIAPLISRLPEKLIDPRTWGDRERQQLP